MIDLRLLREDPDRVRASQRARGEDVALVDAVLSADERRRSSGLRFDELRSEQKSLGKLMGKATPEERAELL
ncbi:serine--tRNA ligase, partial [Streptomyces albidoflavus]